MRRLRSIGLVLLVGALAFAGIPGALAEGEATLPDVTVADPTAILGRADLDTIREIQQGLLTMTGTLLYLDVVPTAGEAGFDRYVQDVVDLNRALIGAGSDDALLSIDTGASDHDVWDGALGSPGYVDLHAGGHLTGRVPHARLRCVIDVDVSPWLDGKTWDSPTIAVAVGKAADGLVLALSGGSWTDAQALIGSWQAASSSSLTGSLDSATNYRFDADGTYIESWSINDNGTPVGATESGTYRLTDCGVTLTPTSRSGSSQVDTTGPFEARDDSIRLEPIDDRPGEYVLYLGKDNYLKES